MDLKKNVLLVDNQYIPNIIYYKNILTHRYIIIDQYESHKKRSFANRSIIAGANGAINLSIPLQKGRSQKTIAKDVRISNDENWQLRHWRSICSSYNNSPWFKFFSDDLAGIFLKRFEFLLDWNLTCLDWTIQFLKLEVNYRLSTDRNENLPSDLLDLRNVLVPGNTNEMDPIRYPQVFESSLGFLPNLSIIDLICNEGPKGAVLLLNGQG